MLFIFIWAALAVLAWSTYQLHSKLMASILDLTNAIAAVNVSANSLVTSAQAVSALVAGSATPAQLDAAVASLGSVKSTLDAETAALNVVLSSASGSSTPPIVIGA